MKLTNLTELELVRLYKTSSRIKDLAFNEYYRRYSGFLKGEANRIFNHIDTNYFSMDFQDCESESIYCLKLALDWFEETKFRGDWSLFNISYYVGKQVDARISSYYWKRYKKQKKNVEHCRISDKFQSFCKDTREGQESHTFRKIIHEKLDSKLSEKELKLKNYLMEGVKENKAVRLLSVSRSEYSDIKESLKQKMILVGMTA